MGQLRRKVHNYTILVLIKEGSMPDFHVKSLAALRVREGEEVDSLYFRDCVQKERQAIVKDMKALHAFLADDLILTADISENMPALEKLYQEYCDAFFTNTTLDICPINEEVTPLMDDPASFKARVAVIQGETDALKRARSTHAIYEEAAEILYGYQKGWPYWICALSTEEERGMEKRLPAKKKKLWIATLCWFFGLHYFYLGNYARNLFYLMTVGGCFLWMLFDLYRLPGMVDESNAKIAEKVYKELKEGSESKG